MTHYRVVRKGREYFVQERVLFFWLRCWDTAFINREGAITYALAAIEAEERRAKKDRFEVVWRQP